MTPSDLSCGFRSTLDLLLGANTRAVHDSLEFENVPEPSVVITVTSVSVRAHYTGGGSGHVMQDW